MANAAPHDIDFLSPVSVCRGIGPKRIAALKASGIDTVGDLFYHLPRRYIDRSNVVPVSSAASLENTICTVAGTIKKAGYERGRRPRYRAQLDDGTGTIELLWFAGLQICRANVVAGARLLATGKVTLLRRAQMIHPIVEKVGDDFDPCQVSSIPVYPLTESMREAGIGSRMLSNAIAWALDRCNHFPCPLPETLERKRAFFPLERCLRQLHQGGADAVLEQCRARLRYEELYKLALTLRWSRRAFFLPGRSLFPGDLASRFRATLPFLLTRDQEAVLSVLYEDAAAPRRMHRLLQGDVGCGKTLVAFFACLPALASGFQVAWLAPTDVLAMQTWRLVNAWLRPLGYAASLLRGAMTPGEKRVVHGGLGSGAVRFVVGTHALLQPSVTFSLLGMIVIDEQHKFGAEQRLALQEKGTASDFLVMSATPIPQTLAQTLYGDLEIVTIRQSPRGRRPVATHLVPGHKRVGMELFVRRQIEECGGAAYWVVPRIEEEDEATLVKDARSTLARLAEGPFRGVPAACLHGRMSNDDKEKVMGAFVKGEIRLLVCTTVIEVGVDVGHATCMIIENAEHFGLAQLHQLRGRVGRGSSPSWCFLLMPEPPDEMIAPRLHYFCTHTDGFAIAEKDLELRGPGAVAGFEQTGPGDLRIAAILRDHSLWLEIQEHLWTLTDR